jgi:hypothetical protein
MRPSRPNFRRPMVEALPRPGMAVRDQLRCRRLPRRLGQRRRRAVAARQPVRLSLRVGPGASRHHAHRRIHHRTQCGLARSARRGLRRMRAGLSRLRLPTECTLTVVCLRTRTTADRHPILVALALKSSDCQSLAVAGRRALAGGFRLSAAVRIWPASVGGRRYLTLGCSSGGCPLCHRNLTFGGGGARWRVSSSATRPGQRLLPLAANGRCRP